MVGFELQGDTGTRTNVRGHALIQGKGQQERRAKVSKNAEHRATKTTEMARTSTIQLLQWLIYLPDKVN